MSGALPIWMLVAALAGSNTVPLEVTPQASSIAQIGGELGAGPTLSRETESALRAAIEEVRARHPAGALSVGVAAGDSTFTAAWGMARDRQAATPRTSYRMASVTKVFTAVAILQLVDDGRIDLDAEVQRYVPTFPRKRWPITVRQLLAHTAGIGHYKTASEQHLKTPHDTAQALALFSRRPLEHEPGSRFLYSSYGYNLLGAVVESVSGLRYGDYLDTFLFAPLGMSRSGMENPRVRDLDQAEGFRVKEGKLVRSERVDISSRFAAGGTRSTVEDLLRFGRALVGPSGHRLLSDDAWRAMTDPVVTTDGRRADYGLGVALYPQRGRFLVAHAGGQPETSTLLLMEPRHHLVIALASNVEGQAELLREVSAAIIEVVLDGGRHRRDPYTADAVDALLIDAMGRVLSHGLAAATRENAVVPDDDTIDAAFEQLWALLDRETIAADLAAARVRMRDMHQPFAGSIASITGAEMARALRDAQGERALESYPSQSPLELFADYLDACRRCSGPRRPPTAIAEDIRRLDAQWRATPFMLASMRPERMHDTASLLPMLAPLVDLPLHPDFSDDLAELGLQLLLGGRADDGWHVLDLNTKLHPRGPRATLALAEAHLLVGDEDVAAELLRALSGPSRHELLSRDLVSEHADRLRSWSMRPSERIAGVPTRDTAWRSFLQLLGRPAAVSTAKAAMKTSAKSPRPALAAPAKASTKLAPKTRPATAR